MVTVLIMAGSSIGRANSVDLLFLFIHEVF